MAAALYVDINRKGPGSLFVKHDKRMFGLKEWGSSNSSGPPSDASQTFRTAAMRVLSEARKPLKVQAITERALRLGFLQTRGRTPSATMVHSSMSISRGESRIQSLFSWVRTYSDCGNGDIEVLKPQIEKEEKDERATQLAGARRRSIVGDPINVERLTYGPLNENGVIFLFSKVQDKLPQPITIEAIQPAFPDAKGRRKTEKGWVDIWIEF
jgi:HB1, ASXL, restriction endonuclease HTH domain